MSRFLRLLIVLTLVLPLLPVKPQPAYAATSPEAADIANGLQNLATVLDSLGDFEELGQTIPITGIDPSADEALKLGSLFGDLFNELSTDPADYADLAALAGALEELDDLYNTAYGDVNVILQDANVVDPDSDGVWDLSFTLAATRTVDAPLAFAHDVVDVGGGSVPIEMGFSVPLTFQYDTTKEDLTQALYLTTAPVIDFTIFTGVSNITAFPERLGFADISVSGNLNLDLDIQAAFADPDGDGKITLEEWSSTALIDLISVDFVDDEATDAVDATLNLDSSLITTTDPDATIQLIDDSLVDGLATEPTLFQLNALEDFTQVNPVDMLGGINQMAAALLAAENISDVGLPFLEENLGEAFDFAQPVLDLVRKQGEAAIICGTEGSDPPRGGLFAIPAGEVVYCQAIALQNPEQVRWDVEGADSSTFTYTNSDGTDTVVTNTVGTNPTGLFSFEMPDPGGTPAVSVSFSLAGESWSNPDTDPAPHMVEPLFQSAEELGEKLVSLAGFEPQSTAIIPAYDPGTHSLTYRLHKVFSAEPKRVTLDFGDQLKAQTNLFDLLPKDDASVDVVPGSIEVDLTFGVLLVDDITTVIPGGTVDDRFFLKVDGTEHELSADATVTVNNLAMIGRVGFLEVEVGGDAAAPANEAGTEQIGTEFSIGRSAPDTPMLAVDIAGSDLPVGSGSLSDVILLSALLDDLTSKVNPTCNVKAEAGLGATASLNGGTPLASGKMGVRWSDVFDANCVPDTGTLAVYTDTDFADQLEVFDIDSNDPLALLNVILDTLETLVATVDSLPGTGDAAHLDTELPLVSKSPRDFLDLLDDLQAAVDELRASPPGTLQVLETELESSLGIDPDLLAFELSDFDTSDSAQDLVIRLGYEKSDSVQETLGLETGSTAAMVGLETNNTFVLSYTASSQLDVGIPLKTSFNPDDIFVVDTSGIELSADVDAPDLNLSANVGPLTLAISGTARLGAEFTLAKDGINTTDNDEIFPVGDFLGDLKAELDGPDAPKDCGSVEDPVHGTVNLTGDACARLGLSLEGPSSASKLSLQDMGDTNQSDKIKTDYDHNLYLPLVLGSTGQQENREVGLDGLDALAELDPNLEATALLGELGFRAEDLTSLPPDDLSTPELWYVYVPDDLTDNIADQLLDWTLLIEILPKLLDQLGNALRGGDEELPLIGNDLAAGAEVIEQVNDKLVTPLSNNLSSALEGLDTAQEIQGAIQTQVFNAVHDSDPDENLLLDANGDMTIDVNDVTVSVDCDGCDINNSGSALLIEDVRISFYIGQGTDGSSDPSQGCTGDHCISASTAFNIGLDGLPLSVDGAVQANVGWKFLVDFGLSRADGPYLVTGPEAGDTRPEEEFLVGASVGLGSNTSACYDGPLPPPLATGFSSERCVEGKLGFLQVNLHDGDNPADNVGDDDQGNDPTRISLKTTLDLTTSSGTRLGLAQLTTGKAGLDLSVEADANLDLLVRTGLNVGASAGFPSIFGAFHVQWDGISYSLSGGFDDVTAPTADFDNLYLHAGTFTDQFLGPVVSEIKRITSPLRPVVDTLMAPLPVVSDLAELVGEDPVTLLDIAEAASGADLSMVESIIAFIDFANGLPTDVGFIPLGPIVGSDRQPGSFSLASDNLLQKPPVGGFGSSLVDQDSMQNGGNLLDEIEGSKAAVPSGRPGTFGVPGLTFPFMENASQIFFALMGEDVTLVRYSTGVMRASAGLSYNFGPILVGPVPISIGLHGSVALEGRFAIGYDTSGLRMLLDGGSPEDLLDGVFIDDLDENNVDVPEIRLIGTVAASAGVDLLIVSAGVEGGLRLTVDLNLNDPNDDGKLRIEEIVDKLDNPICLFDVSGSLDAFLSAYVRIGFAFFSKTFRFEIVSVRLLDFSAACDPPTPQLGSVTGGTLTLLMGPHHAGRHIQLDVTAEKFVVRQLTPNVSESNPGSFSVTAFGLNFEYHNISRIFADGGSDDDQIAMEPGAGGTNGLHNGGTQTGTLTDSAAQFVTKHAIPVGATLRNQTDKVSCTVANVTQTSLTCKAGEEEPVVTWDDGDTYQVNWEIKFTARAEIWGGPGNDQISGGEGGDELYGDGALKDGDRKWGEPDQGDFDDPGNDKINGNGGDDTISGQEGDDILSGNAGTDTLRGQGGNDAITGGPGGDRIEGGDGDDELLGGPHSLEPGLHDLADTIVGGNGNDNIEGHQADDVLYGDQEIASCDDHGGTAYVDQVLGGEGNDWIWGGPGADVLLGEEGHDNICGNEGDDRIDGDDDDGSTDDGNDILNGGSNDDTINGRGGDDDIWGKSGDDTIYGDEGLDDISGGDDADIIHGGLGRDYLFGDNSSASRDPGQANAVAGDLSFAASGGPLNFPDVMYGEEGDDVMYGEGGGDEMYGDAGADEMYGGDGDDLMRGGQEGDTMLGDAHHDQMFGDSGDDTMFGGPGSDAMRGNAGQDDMVGGSAAAGEADDADQMYGDAGHDVMAGDNASITRDDPPVIRVDGAVVRNVVLHELTSSNTTLAGSDVMRGNAGNDRMFGQGNGVDDDGDGQVDEDAVDNIDNDQDGREDGSYGVGSYDCADGVDNDGDGDIDGADHDCALRVDEDPSGDTMFGNDGDDYMEGNSGADIMEGNAGQDDLIGGTSQSEVADGGDTIRGDDSYDVITGDNASITRTPNAVDDDSDGLLNEDPIDGVDNDGDGATDEDPEWNRNSFNGAYTRMVILFDVDRVGGPPVSASTSGGDLLYGGDADDVMFGQGNGDDTDDDGDGAVNEDPADGVNNDGDGATDEDAGGDAMFGGGGDDYMEGNHGADLMYGEGGDDDIVGGGSADDGVMDDSRVGNGLRDSHDIAFGGDGHDVMAGDNATLERPLVNEAWTVHPVTNAVVRSISLWDVENLGDSPTVDPSTSGADTMWGGGEADTLFGQGAGDDLHGGDGFDYMEGNHGGDTMYGDAGQDDMTGGGSADDGVIDDDRVGNGLLDGDDDMYGDDGQGDTPDEGDVMAGDNARISRRVIGNQWVTEPNTGNAVRDVVLFDVENVGDEPPVDPATNGMDTMYGEGEEDMLFGQGADDELHGGDDFDYMEGNHGSDTMYGDAGEDDMTGGGSADDGVIDANRIGNGLLDGEDEMYGDDGDGDTPDDGDVMAGDNARIDRLVDNNGDWQIDPNTGDVLRSVILFDVESIGGPNVDPTTHSSDTMWGEGGRDYMFGQGNNDVDEDDDSHADEDPVDGVDNDRDGRESPNSVGYDCEDSADNDGDGLIDGEDPGCQVAIDEDGGGDEMHGGGGDDYMEGNHGGDWMFGDDGEDDMLGGSSAGPTGIVGQGEPPTGLLDGNDTMHGDSGWAEIGEDDVMLADNGSIVRQTDDGGFWIRLQGGNGFDLVLREAIMTQIVPEQALAFGHDYLKGNGGVDDMYGQQGNDYMEGDYGEDAMVGDLGYIANNLMGDGLDDPVLDQFIRPNEPFFSDTIYVTGSLYRPMILFLFTEEDGAAGQDTLLGDDGNDSLSGGPGSDIMNGDGDGLGGESNDPNLDTQDEDHLFGGEGDDVMWGGRGHDHLWGGYDNDYMDIKPRPEMTVGKGKNDAGKQTTQPADPPEWFTYGVPDNFQEIDYMYGGWDQDAMQANVADEGPVPGDRLIDWVGAYNVYYLCPGLYGEYVNTRDHSPAIIQFLQQLAEGDGAYQTATDGSSGFNNVAMVFPNQAGQNSHPIHPDTPGHFTCVE
jgi:Ca2+-binding RTX toxin-like protein